MEKYKQKRTIATMIQTLKKCWPDFEICGNDFIHPTQASAMRFYVRFLRELGIKIDAIAKILREKYEKSLKHDYIMYVYMVYLCVKRIYASLYPTSEPIFGISSSISFMDFLNPNNDKNFLNRIFLLINYSYFVNILSLSEELIGGTNSLLENTDERTLDEDLKNLELVKCGSEKLLITISKQQAQNEKLESTIKEKKAELKKLELLKDNLSKEINRMERQKSCIEKNAEFEEDYSTSSEGSETCVGSEEACSVSSDKSSKTCTESEAQSASPESIETCYECGTSPSENIETCAEYETAQSALSENTETGTESDEVRSSVSPENIETCAKSDEARSISPESIETSLMEYCKHVTLIENLHLPEILDIFKTIKDYKIQKEMLMKEIDIQKKLEFEKRTILNEADYAANKYEKILETLIEESNKRGLPFDQELIYLSNKIDEVDKEYNKSLRDTATRRNTIKLIGKYCNDYKILIEDQKQFFNQSRKRYDNTRKSLDKTVENEMAKIANTFKLNTLDDKNDSAE